MTSILMHLIVLDYLMGLVPDCPWVLCKCILVMKIIFQIFIFSECRTNLTEGGDLKRLFIHNVTSIYLIIYFKCV